MTLQQPLATATGAVPALVRQIFAKAGIPYEGVGVQGNIGEILVFNGVGQRNNALTKYHLWVGENPEVALCACDIGGLKGIGVRIDFDPAGQKSKAA